MTRHVKDGLTRSLLKPINTSAVIILGVYTVVWGFWVANPFWQAFNRNADVFSVVGHLGPEWGWGLGAAFLGGLTVYGVLRPSYRNLIRGAFALFLQWFSISIFYFVGDWQSTGGITAVTFAVYAAFVWLNLRVNRHRFGWTFKEADDILRDNARKEY